MTRTPATVSMDPTILPFFIYDAPELNSTALLGSCGSALERASIHSEHYMVADHEFLLHIGRHTQRVYNPESAAWFIVPFSIGFSAIWEERNCGDHLKRLHAALDALEKSRWFQRHQGRDHFWVSMNYWWAMFYHHSYRNKLFVKRPSLYFPTQRWGTLRNMVLGRYATTHLNINETVYGFTPQLAWFYPYSEVGQHWRHSVVLPCFGLKLAWMDDQSFTEWQHRKVVIYFRDSPRTCWGIGAQTLRDTALSLQGTIPNILMTKGYANTPNEYAQELQSSKFCLVFQCDDPGASRFWDALAAGCIPFVINDLFLMHTAPFSDRLNYLAFTLNAPESIYARSPQAVMHLAYNMNIGRLRSMYSALLEARKILMWHHPSSETGKWVLEDAVRAVNPS